MLHRVMPELMGMKNILVINDEAHHCYREKPGQEDDGDLKGDDRQEAEKNNEAARVWISGLEVVARKLGVTRVIDLSATPFFLRGIICSSRASTRHRSSLMICGCEGSLYRPAIPLRSIAAAELAR